MGTLLVLIVLAALGWLAFYPDAARRQASRVLGEARMRTVDRWTALIASEFARCRDMAAKWWTRHYVAVIAIFALALTPFWFHLLWTLYGATLDALASSTAGLDGPDIRWHYLAMGSMILALAGLLGAPLVIIRVWTSERQTRTSEQGHVTDRITRAIEQLGAEKTVKRREFKQFYRTKGGRYVKDEDGNPIPARRGDGSSLGDRENVEETTPNLEVRLGAIYALERIAQDSARDHVPIMETLCAYVRENSPAWPANDPDRVERELAPSNLAQEERKQRETNKRRAAVARPRADIQTALDVIGRRTDERIALEQDGNRPFRLNLGGTRLQNAKLSAARLEDADLGLAQLADANLEKARLERAVLTLTTLKNARLAQARLDRAELSGSDLRMAKLGGAVLTLAQLRNADLRQAKLEWADLSGANMRGVSLDGADLRSAKLKGWRCALSSLRSVDFSGARDLHPARLNLAFGVRSGVGRTILPEGVSYPEHWHVAEDVEKGTGEPEEAYARAYRAWLATLSPGSRHEHVSPSSGTASPASHPG